MPHLIITSLALISLLNFQNENTMMYSFSKTSSFLILAIESSFMIF